jgi:hypothetical protein
MNISNKKYSLLLFAALGESELLKNISREMYPALFPFFACTAYKEGRRGCIPSDTHELNLVLPIRTDGCLFDFISFLPFACAAHKGGRERVPPPSSPFETPIALPVQ